MKTPRVFADFHNADAQGRLRLNCIGTVRDLAEEGLILREGLKLVLYSEDLEADGIVQYSQDESVWVALINWDRISTVEATSSALERVAPSDESSDPSTILGT